MRFLNLLMAVTCITTTASAQVTSGAVRGVVQDVTGNKIENANISVIFAPTNQRINTRTTAAGTFVVYNLKPGGPYIVSATALGYSPKTIPNLTVRLGEETIAVVKLEKVAVTLSAVSVSANLAEQARKEGVTTQINEEKLQILPTLSRSLQDMTRMSAQGNGVSFAGSNYRYNNLTIDGATSNDAFGFSQSSGQATASVPTGTPGSLSRTQPISLDAIEQVSVVIAPYDVKVGNFTGGSVNAVTRSGSNRTEGSVYMFGRPAQFVGTGVSGAIPNTFRDYQVGGRVGGRVIANKLFYFANVEIGRRTDPVLFMPGTGNTLATQAIVKQVHDSLVSFAAKSGLANYDPGTFGAYSVDANNEKYFGRLDWNIGNSILTVRSNFVNASAGNFERGQTLTKLGSQDFTHFSRNTNSVAELKTQLGNGVSNSLLLGYSQVHDRRTPYGSIFAPQIEIQDIQFGQINAGSDREGVVYGTRVRTQELTDNLIWTWGKHTFTAGTHNEFYNIQYTFVNGYAGRWQYPNLTAFFTNKPNRIRATYDLTNNTFAHVSTTPGADFNIITPSVYLQDEMSVSDKLKMTVGLRGDWNLMDTPQQSQGFTNLQLTSGETPYKGLHNNYGSSLLIGPRFGVQWKQERVTYRGGLGYFQGRMPFAWYAYPFIHNGLVVGNIDVRPTTTVPLIVDPLRQSTLSNSPTYEMNVIGDKFVQPQMRRMNVAADIQLPYGSLLVLDWTHTKTLKDVVFTNIGLPAPAGNLGGADTRPIYTTTRLTTTSSNPYTSVFALNNTTQGYRYNATATLSKKWRRADMLASYSYGQSKDLANGQRNSFQSHVEYNQLVKANEYPLTWSNFDVRHRIVTNASWKRKNTTVAIVYTGASGSPFSYVYSGDLNGDGSSHNDLIFVPRTSSDIMLVPSTRPAGQTDTRTAAQIWIDLDAFITRDPYLSRRRGQYAERNGARTPWNHRADVRVLHVFGKTEIALDITNVGNLLNKQWGKYYFVPNLNNQNVYPLQYRAGRGVGTTPSFSFDPVANTYQTDDLMSRWQMQLGVRYNF